MLQGFVPTAFVVGTLLTALMPAAGLARDRDDHYRGRRGESRYSEGRGFVNPHRYEWRREYVAPRSYGRSGYRGYYGGGGYLGYGAPYGYGYDNYSEPAYGYNYRDRSRGGSSVVTLQRQLARAGYYHGAIDGIMGPETRRAMRAYQRSRGALSDR